jgi:hypothetical protein
VLFYEDKNKKSFNPKEIEAYNNFKSY